MKNNNKKYYILNFNSIDVSFFRDAKNFKNFVGNVQKTLLPPSKRTFVGAFRNLLARHYSENNNININDIWSVLREKERNNVHQNKELSNRLDEEFFSWWGSKDVFGVPQKSSIHGLFINDYNNFNILDVYVPVPAYLVKGEKEFLKAYNTNTYLKLDLMRAQSLDNCWIKIKNINTPNKKDSETIKNIHEFFYLENRLGIAINSQTRNAEDAQMFECEYIRKREDGFCFSLLFITEDENFIKNITNLIDKEHIVQVGGENKFFRLKIRESDKKSLQFNKGEKVARYIFLESSDPVTVNNFLNTYIKDVAYQRFSYKEVFLGGYDSLTQQQKLADYLFAPGLSFIKYSSKYNPMNNLIIINQTLILTF